MPLTSLLPISLPPISLPPISLPPVSPHRYAYICSGWNQLDIIIVVSSLLAIIAASPQLSGMRVIRSLRALRPLRMISRNPGMQCVVNSLFKSIPGIASVSIIIMLFYLIFAIVFVNLYKVSDRYTAVR